MNKVNFVKLNSANVSVENSSDESRVYDIKGNASVNERVLTSVDNGVVKKDDVVVATFTMFGNRFSQSFQNVTEATDMCDILLAITNFIEDIKKELEGNPISL